MADSDEFELGWAQEAAEYTAETTLDGLVRVTGTGALNRTRNNVTSQEITPGGHVADGRALAESVTGAFRGELSYGAFDSFFEGVLTSPDWTFPSGSEDTNTATCTIAASQIVGAGIGQDVNVGDWIRLETGTGAANVGKIAKVTVASTGSLTLDSAVITDESSASMTIRRLAKVSVGTERVGRTYTLEKRFSDLTLGQQLFGCTIDSLSVDWTTDDLIQLTFGVLGVGQSGDTSGPLLPGGSTTGTASVMASVGDVDVVIGGIPQDIITSVSWNLARNGEPRRVIRPSRQAKSIRRGRANLTGSIAAVFDDATLINLEENETPVSLALVCTDDASGTFGGNTYVFEAPRCRLRLSDVNPPGTDSDIPLNVDFQAVLDAGVTGESVNIWRCASA